MAVAGGGWGGSRDRTTRLRLSTESFGRWRGEPASLLPRGGLARRGHFLRNIRAGDHGPRRGRVPGACRMKSRRGGEAMSYTVHVQGVGSVATGVDMATASRLFDTW